MSEGTVVGSAEFELRATKRKLGEDIKSAENDLKASMGRVERDADKSARGIGASFGRMATGAMAAVSSLVTVLGLAAAGALNLGLQGMRMADDIANSARRIGIGTDALQEWRYVAKATGGEARDADQALDKFATKLSQARAGTSKDAVKAFAFLNMGRDELKGLGSTEQALDKVTDAIKNLKSEADRAAVAEALGLGSLSVALRDGAVDIADLRDEARQLGVVMDANMIERASKAQGEFEILSQIIDVNLKSAFIDMAPAIVGVINLVAQLARALGNAMDAFRDYEDKTERGLADQNQSLRNKVTHAHRRPGGVNGQLSPVQQGWERELAESDAEIARRARREIERSNRTTDRQDGATLALPTPRTPKARASRVDRSEEREARRAERVEQEIFRLRQRALGIADDELMTVQERFDLAKKQVEMEREAEAKELESRLARKDITQAEFNQLKLIQTRTAKLENRVSADILARDLADERLVKERLLTDLTADLLSLQSGAARTAKERLAIELQLLAAAQQKAREDLQRDPTFMKLKPEQQQQALNEQDRVFKAQTDATNRANMGPLDAWRDRALKDAAEVSQAYEAIAANGLDALNSGIVDAIMNSKDLGETFSQVAKQILADLLSISVRRGIIEPLAGMLFGGSTGGDPKAAARAAKGGGSDWMSKAISIGRSMFGFADGGYTGDGGKNEPAGVVHRGEYVFSADAVKRIGAARLEGLHQNLRGYALGGLVGMPSPSFSMAGGGGYGGASQRILHEVIVRPERDSFITLASDAARPIAQNASAQMGKTVLDASKRSMAGAQQSHRRLGTT